MIILPTFMTFWTPDMVTPLIYAHRIAIPRFGHARLVRAVLPIGARSVTGNKDARAWSAVDDRLLTRLLSDCAPRTEIECDAQVTRCELFTAASPELGYAMSFGVYEQYVWVQHLVAYLGYRGFSVEKVELVGTELRSMERVTGRLAGLWMGLLVGIALSLFSDRSEFGLLVATLLLGAVLGLAWNQLGHSAATLGGTREFASANQIMANRNEVLVEHKHAANAYEFSTTIPREVRI